MEILERTYVNDDCFAVDAMWMMFHQLKLLCILWFHKKKWFGFLLEEKIANNRLVYLPSVRIRMGGEVSLMDDVTGGVSRRPPKT